MKKLLVLVIVLSALLSVGQVSLASIDDGGLYTCVDLEKTGPETAEPGETITYHFWVHNCGEVILHGGYSVYDPLLNPSGDHSIWWNILPPGETHEFDKTYTVPDDYCGELINSAWTIGRPLHPDGYYLPFVRDDDAWTTDVICEPQELQGCTPGYWKQEHHFDSWVGYAPGDSFDTIFSVDAGGKTLLEALMAKGGKENALMRHATAALLNVSSGDVSYLYSVSEIIGMVQEAFDSGDFNGTKDLFETQNELGCPLD